MFGHAQYNLYNIFTILNHYKYRCLNIFFTTISHLIFDISNTTNIEHSRFLRIPEYCVLDKSINHLHAYHFHVSFLFL